MFYKERTCVHLELKEAKSITNFLLLKAHPISVFSVDLNNLAELQLLSMMGFSFNTLPH